MQKKNGIFAINPKEVEELVSSRHGNPRHILGMHVSVDGIYVSAYIPGTVSMSLINLDTGKEYPMEQRYADGFFTVRIEGRKAFAYAFNITMWNGKETFNVRDCYSFDNVTDRELLSSFINNGRVRLNTLFGAHKTVADGVEGVAFSLNVPDAARVSVVGDFNGWDSRCGMMNKIDYTDCYELFVPGDLCGNKYKFEVLRADGSREIFADPYATCYEPYPGDASVIADMKYEFNDDSWMKERTLRADKPVPLNIYEVFAPGFMKNEDGGLLSYDELGSRLSSYVTSMGYNYVELMPVMSYREESSLGYDMYGAYAPDARMGSPASFMKMVDIFHEKGIGVILDMVPVKDEDCILYWIETYHIDGVRLDDMGLIEKLKEEAGAAYPGVLFDVFFNVADTNKLLSYIKTSPVRRGGLGDAMNGMSGTGIMALSHDIVGGYEGLIDMMPGGYEDKFASLRILYALNMTMPKAKLMFMGQELGQPGGLYVSHDVDRSVLEFDANRYVSEYTKALNKLYLKEPALYDNDEISFESTDTEGVSCFFRYSDITKEKIYVICNSRFKDISGFQFAVSGKSSYKEIFSSDDMKYGGEGKNNKTIKKADKNSMININLPALSVTIIKAGC